MTLETNNNLWRQSHKNSGDFTVLNKDIRTDLLIVGGGYTGCSAALEASKAGAKVTLLEAETIGHGGSGRNVGLVNAGLWTPPEVIFKYLGQEAGMRLVRALAEAPDLVFRIIEEHSISCEAVRNGTLHLAHAPSGLRDLNERFRQGKQIDAPIQLLDAKETARRTGSEAFFGSLFDPRAGTIQPLAYCRGLASAARSSGAQVFEKSKLNSLHRDNSLWVAKANGHTIRADKVLLAINAYGGNIQGAPSPEFVPVHYSQFATAPLPDGLRHHILPGREGCWDTALVMSSVRIDAAGRLIIGGVGNLSGAGAAIHAKWAARKLAKIYPDLAGTSFEHGWEGAIAMTSDHIPKVLAFGPNALSVFGYSGRGIGPGTVFGKHAARALLFGETAGLPLEVIQNYRESLKTARKAYFEFGAALSHALHPNSFLSRE